jgi:uncharacterized membrane protein YgcG
MPDETVDGEAVADPVLARSHPILRYSTARIALFVAASLLVWLVHLASGALLVMIALLVSGLASYVLLGRQRAELSVALFELRERRRAKAAASAAREDSWDDANPAEAPEAAFAPAARLESALVRQPGYPRPGGGQGARGPTAERDGS